MSLEGTFTDRVQRALHEIKAGRMVILVDDEDRENEGDLVMAADAATPEAVNFMVRYARGLVCLTLTEDQVQRLGLPMMVDQNHTARSTAFTVSIEAREGVTTGISAADRAHTIRVAANPSASPRDVLSPGHIFPLRAKPGGVLQRTGHTEGSVDLARLAGLNPSAVICEIMNDDGSMARMPDLRTFAQTHGLTILSIEDLIHYRLQRDRLVRRVETAPFRPAGFAQTWTASVYEAIESRQFLALSLGELDPETPTLVRMHPGAMFADLFAPPARDGADFSGGAHLFAAMRKIEAEGRGAVVYIPPNRVDLAWELRCLNGAGNAAGAFDKSADGQPAQREFGLGAQVLVDLGLRRIRLATNNPRKLVGLGGYGLEVVGTEPLGDASATTLAAAVRTQG